MIKNITAIRTESDLIIRENSATTKIRKDVLMRTFISVICLVSLPLLLSKIVFVDGHAFHILAFIATTLGCLWLVVESLIVLGRAFIVKEIIFDRESVKMYDNFSVGSEMTLRNSISSKSIALVDFDTSMTEKNNYGLLILDLGNRDVTLALNAESSQFPLLVEEIESFLSDKN